MRELCPLSLSGALVYALLLVDIPLLCISETSTFLVSPGGGREYTYSPVGENTALECRASNSTIIWEVDNLAFDRPDQRALLNRRNIYQFGPPTLPSVLVVGDVKNNSSRVCCEAVVDGNSIIIESCTTLILYGPPSPPIFESVQFTDGGCINISWSAPVIPEEVRREQMYTVTLFVQNLNTSEQTITEVEQSHYYIFKIGRSCDWFNISLRANNGAGSSELSSNESMVLPSLPDIEPVSSSLQHQLWKENGRIMVKLSFEPALSCVEYPVIEYLISLSSNLSEENILFNVTNSTAATQVSTVLHLQDLNQLYQYRVIAVNTIGSVTSDKNYFVTSDVQFISAKAVGDYVCAVECLFINGSDALGCKVHLVSDHPTVETVVESLIRKNDSISSSHLIKRELTLPHPVSCYRHVLAFDIESDNNISEFAINGNLTLQVGAECLPSVNYESSHGVVAAVVSVLTITVVGVLMSIMFIILWFRIKKVHSDHVITHDQEQMSFDKNPAYETVIISPLS